jgi:CHASE2 domain-containing sensor protein
MMSRRRRRLFAGLLIGAGIGLAFCLAFWLNLLSTLQLQSSDFFFKASNSNRSIEQEGKIVIVAIDDSSLEQLGHFPSWSRSYYADLIDMLAEAEARTVVFDILFSEQAPGDEQLANSIEEAGNVILPLAYTVPQQTFAGAGELVGVGTFIRPLSSFEQYAIALGHANLQPDADGVVRQLPLVIDNGEGYEPALALAAVAKYLRRPIIIESPVENNYLPFAGRMIPLNDANGMLIN